MIIYFGVCTLKYIGILIFGSIIRINSNCQFLRILSCNHHRNTPKKQNHLSPKNPKFSPGIIEKSNSKVWKIVQYSWYINQWHRSPPRLARARPTQRWQKGIYWPESFLILTEPLSEKSCHWKFIISSYELCSSEKKAWSSIFFSKKKKMQLFF